MSLTPLFETLFCHQDQQQPRLNRCLHRRNLVLVSHRARTPKRIREALNDFALVCRGLAGTAYGSGTVM